MSRQYLFDDPKNVRTLVRGLITACAVLVLLDMVFRRHLVHPWESLFGFYALFGFTACVLLVLLAKEMRKLLMRGEDYYLSRNGARRGGHEDGEDDG